MSESSAHGPRQRVIVTADGRRLVLPVVGVGQGVQTRPPTSAASSVAVAAEPAPAHRVAGVVHPYTSAPQPTFMHEAERAGRWLFTTLPGRTLCVLLLILLVGRLWSPRAALLLTLVACVVAMWRNLGKREAGTLSAYSIFNPGFQALPGQLRSDQFTAELRGGLSTAPDAHALPVGRATPAEEGAHAHAQQALFQGAGRSLRSAPAPAPTPADEDAELQAAIQRSLHER